MQVGRALRDVSRIGLLPADIEERNHMPLSVPDISRNLFDLSDYCSIITGAGQGIGLVLAEALAYAGSDLVLTELRLPPARLRRP